MGFDTYYSDNPWTGFDRNQRSVYWPELLTTFRAHSVWRPFVRYVSDLAAQRTGIIYFDEVFDTEPDTTPIADRAIWLPSRRLDSRRVSLSMEHHGDKLALHKFDRIVTYWRQNGQDLSGLCRGKLGQNMVDYLDILARNAMLAAPYVLHMGTASDFGSLTAGSHKYTPQTGQKIWKSMANMNVPMANNPNAVVGTLLAITSPTVIFDMIDNDATSKWVDVMTYSQPELRLRYEMGMWASVRYLQTTRNTLFNVGAITHQTTLAADADPGDGAYSGTVDGVYTVGQGSGVTNYVSVTDASGFSVGDIVTLHQTRTSAYGVTNGVNPTEGTARHRRIVNIAGNNIAFDRPLQDAFTTSHYVTLATDVHVIAYIGGPCLASGVGQQPTPHAPPPVDDLVAIQRFTWDAYIKYQLFRPEYGAAVYAAGSNYYEYEFS